jgi:hypothetical protein
MSKCYRVIFQTYDESKPDTVIEETPILDSKIEAPTNCLNFSMGMEQQLEVVHRVQDQVLNEKLKLISENQNRKCPQDECHGKLVKGGKQKSPFNDVFTDHIVTMQRFRCNTCCFETASSVKILLGSIQSGELQKIQSQLGSTHTYRESEELLSIFSGRVRPINNHDRIKNVSEAIGSSLAKISETEKEIYAAEPAAELILNVDGGHIKTNDSDLRSIEAMTSVVYQPESLLSNDKGTRNYLSSKNCAASVQDDGQKQIIYGTIVAALKQGLSKETKITALCDGAKNCWSIVESLRPLCGSMTCILDWFHIGMKMKNISLPEELKNKFLRVKWHLWRGNVDHALRRLRELSLETTSEKIIDKINKFRNYVSNNRDKIVNYRERKNNKLVFTSNLAESTVESLINRRCKGQQHMRWSREGLDPLLQIRAALKSKGEWESKWKTAVLNAV